MMVGSMLKKIASYNSKNVVITGGEPLLQQTQLIPLLHELRNLGKYVIIETNGTVMPAKEFSVYIDHYAVSPKLVSSGNHIEDRINYDVLYKLNNYRRSIFKFVIKTDQDLDEVKFLQDQIGINSSKIYLMKEGGIAEKQYYGLDEFIKTCLSLGYNFSPRLHVMIWDNKRGV